MEIYIYAISHPITNEIRYIGKSVNIKRRLIGHISKSRNNNNHFHNWIKSILNEGLKPKIEIIKHTNEQNWMQDEKDSIIEYRENGHNLLNIAEGGNEPYCSKEQRAINGRNTAKDIHSNEYKKTIWKKKLDMANALKGLYKIGEGDKADKMRIALAKKGFYFNIKDDGY